MIPDTVTEQSRAGHVQRVLRWCQDEEHTYMSHGNRQDPTYLPWMPFQIGEFTSFMTEIVAEANGSWFLDIGCGIGTKMLLARELFGLDPHGIEVDIAMAKRASTKFPYAVICADALADFYAYTAADIIWMYRPFRNAELQDKLEAQVMESMKPGAILAGAKWQMDRPPKGWITVIDDWELKAGAWMKPGF
jgi:SAM-dependent methyltransferase